MGHGTPPCCGSPSIRGTRAARSRAGGGATRASWSRRCAQRDGPRGARARRRGWRGPRSLWEQVGLPARLARLRARRRARAELLPAAAPPVPGRGDDPRPRLRGLPGRLRAAHAGEVPLGHAARGALGRAGDLRVARSRATTSARATASTRRGCGWCANAPSLPLGRRAGRPAARRTCSASATCGRRRTGAGWSRRGGRCARAGSEHRLVIAGPTRARARRCAAPRAASRSSCRATSTTRALDALMRGAARSCTRRCTRASAWWSSRRWRAACRSRRRAATALPEAGGDAAVYFDPLDVDAIAAAIVTRCDRRRRARRARPRAGRGAQLGARGGARRPRSTRGGRAMTTILLLSVDEAPMLAHSLPLAVAQDGRRRRRDRQRAAPTTRRALAREHGARVLRARASASPTRRR